VHFIPEPIAVEARAKITWGEPPEKVRAFLMTKGIGEKDAASLLQELLTERAASIRSDGMKKVWLGGAFIVAPVAYYFVTHFWIGYWDLKFFAALIVVGVVGLAKATTGFSMVIRPQAVRGDLANSTDI